MSHTPHDSGLGNSSDEHEGGGHGEPWLVSYADMMTLLFGFFVLMYSFASSSPAQKEQIKKQLAKSMGGSYATPFAEVAKNLRNKIQSIKVEADVDIIDGLQGVVMVLKGTLFFDSGSTTLKPQAQELMHDIAMVLAKEAKTFHIIVEGHTDDSPISMPGIPSNWELSAMRSGTVVRMFEQLGMERGKLRAVGLADTEPLVPNRDANGAIIPQNQAENRRIVIRIQP